MSTKSITNGTPAPITIKDIHNAASLAIKRDLDVKLAALDQMFAEMYQGQSTCQVFSSEDDDSSSPDTCHSLPSPSADPSGDYDTDSDSDDDFIEVSQSQRVPRLSPKSEFN